MILFTRSSHRDYFRKYLFFSSRSTFFWIFPGRLYVCSPNRYIFSRMIWSVRRTDTIFSGAHFMCSPNRYRFSRSTFLATEQIQIFQEHFFLATEQIPIFQEHLFSYQTDNNFFRKLFSNINKQIGNFQEGTPPPPPLRTDISGGCFRLTLRVCLWFFLKFPGYVGSQSLTAEHFKMVAAANEEVYIERLSKTFWATYLTLTISEYLLLIGEIYS